MMSETTRRILFSCAAVGLVICLCLSAASIAAALYLFVK
jgi:hypothetical protein